MKRALAYLKILFVVMIIVGVIEFLPWWVLLIPVALLISLALISVIKNWNRVERELERDGFTTSMKGKDWFFEEVHEGAVRSFPVFAFESGPEPYYEIPDLIEWATKPDWAIGRREEIVRKMFLWLKPRDIVYPPDWNYTPEEKAADEAEKLEREQYFEQMKKDHRIGEEDSEYKLEYTADGIPMISRKTPEELKRPRPDL